MTQGVAFRPTAEQRRQVEVLAGFGLPQLQIAVLVACDPKTLRKYFEAELAVGDAKATAKIAQTLFNKAAAGDTACMIFWMKVRGGWSETARVEVSGPDGGPVELAQAAHDRIVARLDHMRLIGSAQAAGAEAP